MNATTNSLFRISLAAIALAATTLGGCAHHPCSQSLCDFGCYSDWPCYGYHSTCWRPWPGECIPCPSPYMLTDLPSEAVPTPLPFEPELTPAPPADIVPPPMPEIPPGEAPPGEPAPDPAAGLESSSRRRVLIEDQYSLDSLRWAPTDNP